MGKIYETDLAKEQIEAERRQRANIIMAQLESLKARLSTLQNEKNRIEGAKKAAEAKKEQNEKWKKQSLEEKSKAELERVEAKDAINQLNNFKETLNTQFTQCQNGFDSIGKESNNIKYTESSIDKSLSGLQGVNTSIGTNINNVAQAMNNQKTAIDIQISEEEGNHNKKIDELSKQIERLESEIEELEAEISKLVTEIDRYNNTITSLNQEIESLNGEISRLQNELRMYSVYLL